MTAPEKPFELGLYISRERDCINAMKVKVTVVRRSDDGEHIHGLSHIDYYERVAKRHAGRHYEGLVMSGQPFETSAGPKEWIAYEPRYESLSYVELREARRIVKTLAELEKAKERWSREHGSIRPVNMFAILAKFADAKFVVYQDNTVRRHGGYANWEWRFLSIESGIRMYQHEIDRVLAEHVSEKERIG